MAETAPIIQFRDIKKAFGSKVIYDGLNLDVYPGETLTIIGGSGVGKSVMLKMLVGLLTPDAGSIKAFDKQLAGMSDEKGWLEMRRRIAMLFQSGALFDSMTVEDNIRFPLIEHGWGTPAEMNDRVAEVLEMVGVPGTQKLLPNELSGGMRKRVGLARSIAIQPEVILYDEPTTGLDPINVRRINGLILSLQERLGVTSMVVTHDMDSVFTVTDRLAMVYNHQIAFVGTPDEAKTGPLAYLREFISGGRGTLGDDVKF
ncbi:MAG: ATP-binding cassette domain-containing protein [Myxococcota bacterium]